MPDNKNDLNKKLETLGFSESEAQVYLAMLPRGSMSIQEITEACGLPRSTVALVLEKFLESGVIKSYTRGKRRQFFAENTDNLMNFLVKEEREIRLKKLNIQKLLPDLDMLHFLKANESIQARFLQGEEGLKNLYNETLKLKNGSEILRISVLAEKFTVIPDFLKGYVKLKNKKNITTKLLIPESALGKIVKAGDSEDMRETRFLSKDLYDPSGQIAIWGEKVSFTTWDKGLNTIIIENKFFSEMMQMIFINLWNCSKK